MRWSPAACPPRASSFRIGRTGGATTVLNPAPACDLSDELLAEADVPTPNESELRLIARLAPDAPIEAAAQSLLG